MKFQVFRTSDYCYDEGKPCEEAKFEKVECRSVMDNGKRLIAFYTVEINTLEELLDFIKKYGRITLDKSYDKKYYKDFKNPTPGYEIEICDCYEE